ncbi:MAG: hypothetical protein OEY19_09960, partial [Gammaproteobacteria bacterium]|nr:hypothetical protein [Gammaproteobacteria bacterium]
HIKEHHLRLANQLGLDATDKINSIIHQLLKYSDEINLTQTITPESHAKVLAIGEILSTTIGCEYLKKSGFNVYWQDAREILISNNAQDDWHHFTSNQCDYSQDGNLADSLSEKADVIVTQGFIAADESGKTVLLGREGSDTSAAYFAAKLNACKLEIWTDVSGIYSSNPGEINNTQTIPQLSYQQAQQMAKFGAKVLHPGAVKPALESNIPIEIKNTRLPADRGSKISAVSESERKVLAVVYESKVTQVIANSDSNEDVLFKLGESGFEVLLTEMVDNQTHIIAIYKNSDMPQLDDDLLEKKIDGKVVSNLALVTVVGNDIQENFQNYQRYFDEKKNRISLLCKAEDCLAIVQSIHDKLIDTQCRNQGML